MFKIWGESQHIRDGFDRFFLGFLRKQKVRNIDLGVGQLDVDSTGWLVHNWSFVTLYSDPKFRIHIGKLLDDLWLD